MRLVGPPIAVVGGVLHPLHPQGVSVWWYGDAMSEERRATTVRLRVSTLEWLKVEALRRRSSVTKLIEDMVTGVRLRSAQREDEA